MCTASRHSAVAAGLSVLHIVWRPVVDCSHLDVTLTSYVAPSTQRLYELVSAENTSSVGAAATTAVLTCRCIG